MRWFAALALLAVAGCTQPASPELDVDPENASLHDMQTWRVRLTLEEPFTYDHPGCGPELFRLEVTGTANGTVRLYEYGREPMFGACVITPKTLPAGEHVETFHWNGRVEGAQPDAHEGDRVPAGTYTLHAALRGTNMTAQGTVEVVAG